MKSFFLMASSMMLSALIGAAVFFLLVEWAAGCGAPIYHKDGPWATGKCVFFENEIKSGDWK